MRSGLDEFLEWLHLLMLMNDTVLMATSREGMTETLNVLAEWCDRSGLVIYEEETEFIAFVTTSVEDRKPRNRPEITSRDRQRNTLQRLQVSGFYNSHLTEK